MATVTDSFTGTDQSPLAAPWTEQTVGNGFNRIGNVAVPRTTGTDGGAIYNGTGAPAWGNDQSISGAITVSATSNGNGIGFWLRYSSAGGDNGYRFVCNHDASLNCAIRTAVAGTYTTPTGGNFTHAFTDADQWEFRVVGSTITVYHLGALVATVTDTAVTSGSPGMAMSSPITSGSIDDVTITDAFNVWPPADAAPFPRLQVIRSSLRLG